MIDYIKQTPKAYSEQSRDYQLLARLFTAAGNSSRMYIDNMNVWQPDIDNKLSNLRAETLNFFTEHSWSLDALDEFTSVFKKLIRLKGTRFAIQTAVNVLLRALNLENYVDDQNVTIDGNEVQIRVNGDGVSYGILDDILSYLLPAGTTYRIIKYKVSSLGGALETLLELRENVEASEEQPSYTLYIGDDKKIRYRTNGYIYSDSEMTGIADSNNADPNVPWNNREVV